MTLFTWDTEAEEWDRTTNVCFISEHGDVEHFEGPSSMEQASDFIDENPATYAGHAAGIYDTLLLSQVRERPWQDLTIAGGAVLCAHDRGTRMRDTYRWWLNGLKKVGEAMEKEDDRREARGEPRHGSKGTWLKKDVDRARMSRLTAREKRDYCESDTRILMEGVQSSLRYLDEHEAQRAWTAGSSAMNLLKAMEPASWGVLEAFALDFSVAVRAAACVRGARVETWALGRVENVHIHDIKSAYPAAVAREEIGVGAVHLGPHDLDQPGAVWRVRWFWPWRGGEDGCPNGARVPPVLDQVTGAGAGWCEAWCIREELDELERFVEVQRIEGWAPLAMVPLGHSFFRELFAEKEDGSFFAKVYINGCIGKFAQQPVQECWKSGAKPTDYFGPEPALVGDYWRYLKLSVDKRGRCRPNTQPLAAAHALGRARIRLWKIISALLVAGYEVYYCDTDSVHTNADAAQMRAVLGDARCGDKLGQLAHEGGPFTILYVGPKSYCAVDPSTGKVKKGACKGMSWNALADGERVRHMLWGYVYRQKRALDDKPPEDMRLAVFEEALRDVGGATVVKEGIATWRQGLRRNAGWSRLELPRKLQPHERGKRFDRASGPTAYSYRTPAELLLGRGVELSTDPFSSLTHNAITDARNNDEDEDAIVYDLFGERG